MTTRKQAEELFDRYVAEVGQHLPRRLCADLELEMRSLLEDTLVDRCQACDPDLDLAVEILQELGPPAEVAASFIPKKHLVGPRFYPAFQQAMQIIWILLGVIYLVSLVVALNESDHVLQDLLPTLIQSLPQLAAALFASLGSLVVIFALVERVLPAPQESDGDWDPLKLAAINWPDRLRRGALIWEIGISLGLIILFNFYRHKIGAVFLLNGRWNFVPLLTPDFAFLPWLNIRWVLGPSLAIVLLRQGRWHSWNRWVSFALSLYSLVLVYLMIAGGPLIALPTDWSMIVEGPAEWLGWIERSLVPSLALLVDVVLVITFMVMFISLLRQLFRLLRQRSSLPWHILDGDDPMEG